MNGSISLADLEIGSQTDGIDPWEAPTQTSSHLRILLLVSLKPVQPLNAVGTLMEPPNLINKPSPEENPPEDKDKLYRFLILITRSLSESKYIVIWGTLILI